MEQLSLSAGFAELPLDLLPLILSHLQKRADLARASLVAREWLAVAQPLLFRWIRLWGRDLVSDILCSYRCLR